MSGNGWFIVGQSLFGLLIGVFAGLSISPLVATLIGLIFVFVGGSLLSVLKERTEDERMLLGKSIAMFSLFMVIGTLSGIFLRTNDGLTLKKDDQTSVAAYVYSQALSEEDLVQLSLAELDETTICVLIKAHKSQFGNKTLNVSEVVNKIHHQKGSMSIIKYLLSKDLNCNATLVNPTIAKETTAETKSNTHLYNDKISSEEEKSLWEKFTEY